MQLEVTNLSKYYGARLIFENVTCYIDNNDRIGLVGDNGAGKSTFCNIIASLDPDYDGRIKKYPGAKVAYFKQMMETEKFKDLTIFEYILTTQQKLLDIETEYNQMLAKLEEKAPTEAYLQEFGNIQENYFGSGAHDLLERMEIVLNGLGIYESAELLKASASARDITWEMKMDSLSGGERKIVELATILLNVSANVLILDEPTNHLDIEARAWLESFIRQFKGAVVIVSHDRYLLNSVASKIWEITEQTLTTYTGNFDRFSQLKKEKYEALMHTYNVQQKELGRLIAIMKALHLRAKRSESPAIISQYNAMKTRIVKFEKKMIKKPESRPELNLSLRNNAPKGHIVVKMENYSFSFSENKIIFKNQSILFSKNDKVALLGANGIGKSTLIKLILTKYCSMHRISPETFGIRDFYDKYQEDVIHSENFYIGPSVKIAYYSQHHNQLPENLTIRDLLWDDGVKEEGEFQSIIKRFHFDKKTVDKKIIKSLSGGEKSKLQFILLMLSDANTLLLDEPINHLDIASMKVVEDVLAEFPGALFVISHDRHFLGKVVNKIVHIKDKGIHEYFGTIDEYIKETYDK